MEKSVNILVPVDFSVCSKNALKFALQLADKIKANLRVVTVLHFDANDMENIAYALDGIEESKMKTKNRMIKFIETATESVRASLDEIPTTQISIEIGKLVTTICDVATRNEVDYIIMGTQGENSTLDKYLGSVASNVLKNAPSPVIVIPENVEFEKKMQLGYATDFSEADPFEIWKVVKLFQPFQPKVKCVHFNEKQVYKKDKIKELETYFKETSPKLSIEFYSLPVKDKVKDMNNFIENENINMLVMYKLKRSFFESIFHKSYTQKMAMYTNIPLMVLMENK